MREQNESSRGDAQQLGELKMSFEPCNQSTVCNEPAEQTRHETKPKPSIGRILQRGAAWRGVVVMRHTNYPPPQQHSIVWEAASHHVA